jgi:N-acetylneuraminate synthase
MTINVFSIGKHIIGGGNAFIIAEVAQAHDGSLGTAHAYVDAIAEAGADAVKFQTHIACEESTLDEPFRVKFSCQDKTRYDYWKRMEFSEEQWSELYEHARRRGLVFLSSPFSVKAVEILRKTDMPAWKVGSGEINTPDILDAIIDTKAPVLVSTGMSNFEEIDKITKILQQRGMQFALFQCTSRYPAPLEEVGLNVIDEMRMRFDCPVGLSDHSGSVFPSLAALIRGADMIEVHVVIDKRLFGPDVAASISIDELSFVAKARDAFYAMNNNPVDKDAFAGRVADTKLLFSKSMAPVKALKAGTILEKEMVTLKKPGTGIQFSELYNIIGRSLKRDVFPEKLLKWDDIV